MSRSCSIDNLATPLVGLLNISRSCTNIDNLKTPPPSANGTPNISRCCSMDSLPRPNSLIFLFIYTPETMLSYQDSVHKLLLKDLRKLYVPQHINTAFVKRLNENLADVGFLRYLFSQLKIRHSYLYRWFLNTMLILRRSEFRSQNKKTSADEYLPVLGW